MTYKRHRLACGLLMIVLAARMVMDGIPLKSARAETDRLLVLYDTAGNERTESNLLSLRRILTYTSQACDYLGASSLVSTEKYSAVLVVVDESRALHEDTAYALRTGKLPVFVIGGGAIEQLAKTQTERGSIVVRCTTETGTSSDFLLKQDSIPMMTGEASVIGGALYVDSVQYPLCKRGGNITHMAYCDGREPLLAAALATYLQAWRWPYQNAPTGYGQYLVLDNVYPFYEPEDLMKVTDMLREEDVPYAITLMPVYGNADYPSMKRFCEWARYIQSTGAGIVLRSPLVSLEQVDLAMYQKQLAAAYGAYTLYGVYPVAIEAPEAYLQSRKGIEVLKHFRTVLLFESDDVLSDIAEEENLAYYDGHQLIAPYDPTAHALTTAYAQAIYLDVTKDVEELRNFVRTIKRSRRVLKSLNDMEHSVYIGKDLVQRFGAERVTVNGKAVSLQYDPFVYEDYTFQRGIRHFLTNQIETSNQVIMAFVLVAGAFFLIAIVLSRRAIRRAILHPGNYKRSRQKKKQRAEKGEGE